MLTMILLAYAAVALVGAAHAIAGLNHFRPRPGEHLDAPARALLAGVALLAGAAWGLLAVLFVGGWIRSPHARALAARITTPETARPRLGPWRRVRHATR